MCVFFSSRRRHTRYWRDWSSDVCSSDLRDQVAGDVVEAHGGDDSEPPLARRRGEGVEDAMHVRLLAGGGEGVRAHVERRLDRKSTPLKSSHAHISYALFSLKKKQNILHL